jgi:hypothetical protein
LVERFLISYPWIAAIAWAVLCVSDHHLTLLGQRYFKSQKIVEIEGSYELTPEHQDDIDNELPLSWLWLIWTVFGAAVLLMTGLFATQNGIIQIWYLLLMGALLILQLGVHERHIWNILFYKHLASSDPGVEGRVYWRRTDIYRRSATQLWLSAAFTLILAGLSSSYILLGGAFGLAGTARRHGIYARRSKTISRSEAELPSPDVSESV